MPRSVSWAVTVGLSASLTSVMLNADAQAYLKSKLRDRLA